jgi:hypothetical protein
LILSFFWRYWAFLEPKFWEEVGDEQPTSNLYKPGLFEAMEDSQSGVVLKGSQAKAIFMQGSYLGADVVGPFLGASDVHFACRFLCRVLEIWKNMNRSIFWPIGTTAMYFLAFEQK